MNLTAYAEDTLVEQTAIALLSALDIAIPEEAVT